MNETTHTLLIACIATIAYAPLFMVAFDLFLALGERHLAPARGAETDQSVTTEPETAPAVTAAPRRERKLRGLAAQPTMLSRSVMDATFRPVETRDEAMPGLLANLDKVPPTPVAVPA